MNGLHSNLSILVGWSFFVCFAVIILQSSICKTGTAYLSYLLVCTPWESIYIANRIEGLGGRGGKATGDSECHRRVVSITIYPLSPFLTAIYIMPTPCLPIFKSCGFNWNGIPNEGAVPSAATHSLTKPPFF